MTHNRPRDHSPHPYPSEDVINIMLVHARIPYSSCCHLCHDPLEHDADGYFCHNPLCPNYAKNAPVPKPVGRVSLL